MAWQLTPYTAPLLLIGVFAAVISYLIWKRNARVLASVIAALSVAILAETIYLSSTVFEVKLFFLLASFYGHLLIGVAWFLFSSRYAGRDKWWTKPELRYLLLFIVGVGVFVASNPLHELVVYDVSVTSTDSMMLLDYSLGEGAWLVFGLLYLFSIIGIVFVYGVFRDSKNLYRKQSLMLILGVIPPLIGHMASATGYSPFPNFTLAALLFVVSGVLLLIALYGYKFVDVVPMARDRVMQELRSGVVVLDHNNRVTDINSAGMELLGVKDPVGKTIQEVLGDHTDIFSDYSRGDELHSDVTIESNGVKHLDFRASPLLDHRDNTIGTLILINDITTLKEREEELKRQNERLDKFANVLSHDLRNPLNVADGYLDLAREEEDLGYLEKVRESHERMSDIIEDVLTLAKQGQRVTNTQEVDLEEVVEEAWVNVATENAELSHSLDLTVEGDRDRLLRMFENLFRNSVEHGDSSTQIRVGSLDNGFFIEDNGPGIPESERDAVFEQGYTTTEDGTGFGLSIVQSIVDAHGWSIIVDESDSGGARFEILLK